MEKDVIGEKKHDFAIWKHILFILVIFVIFFAVSNLVNHQPVEYTSVLEYATTDVTYKDGSTKHVDSNYFGNVNRGDQVEVHVFLPEELKVAQGVLCFDIYHSATEVWYENQLITSGGIEEDNAGNMVGYEAYSALIPDEAWGHSLTIRLRPTENNAFVRLHFLRIYPEARGYKFFIDVEPIRFFFATPMLIVAFFFLVLVLLFRQERELKHKGICYAICLLLLACYLCMKSELPYMMTSNHGLWNQLEFISAITVSYPLFLYLVLSLPKGRYKTFCKWLFILEQCFFIVITVLHFTNLAHYCVTMNCAHVLTFINIVLILSYSIKGHSGDTLSWRLRYDSFVLAALCGLVDVTRNSILNMTGVSIPSVLHFGLMGMIIGMMLSYLIEIAEQQKKSLTEQLRSQRLEQILAQIPAGICVVDMKQDGRILQANEAFFRIRGEETLKSKNILGQSIYDCVLEKDRDYIRQLAEQLMASQKNPPDIETSILCDDGIVRNMLAKAYIDFKDMTATVNVVDITERKKAEDELRISESRYRLALTQSGKVFFFFDIPSKTIHLSEDLAQAFGVPKDVDHMPDKFIDLGLLEKQSIKDYRDFYTRIFQGEQYGDTIISCHISQNPEQVRWYRMTFTSVFNEQGAPQSAIITYEDLSEQHQNEIANAWKPQNLLSISDQSWSVAEYNLTQNIILDQRGNLFPKIPDNIRCYEEINEYVCSRFIFEEDAEGYRRFLDRNRIIECFSQGTTEDVYEYRSLQAGDTPRWTRTTLQVIRDPYSQDVLSQMFFLDINAEKTGQLEMQHNMDELRKELENSRIRIMINQMQPHFLYNALSAIQTIVKTDPDYAYQLIYDFTVHLRASIKALSSDQPIPFKDELKNIKAYLNIEQMRFGQSLKIIYDIQCDDFSIIPLSIQPLAENAARHGIYPKGGKGGTVTIRTYETLSSYVVEVEDDGVGFDVEEVMNRQSDSIGLKNMIFRMKSLMNASVVVESHIDQGTKVTVTIPVDTSDKS